MCFSATGESGPKQRDNAFIAAGIGNFNEMPLFLLDQMQPLLMLVKLNPLAMDFYLGMTLDPIPPLLYLLLITMPLLSSRSCSYACGCNVSLAGVSLQEYNDLR